MNSDSDDDSSKIDSKFDACKVLLNNDIRLNDDDIYYICDKLNVFLSDTIPNGYEKISVKCDNHQDDPHFYLFLGFKCYQCESYEAYIRSNCIHYVVCNKCYPNGFKNECKCCLRTKLCDKCDKCLICN